LPSSAGRIIALCLLRPLNKCAGVELNRADDQKTVPSSGGRRYGRANSGILNRLR
jgi:hypothetical protein